MKDREHRLEGHIGTLLGCLGLLLGHSDALAATVGDAAQLISVSIPAGTLVMPRTMFTQTWTMLNTGTNTWSAGQSGYTMNIVGKDSLGAVPLAAKTYASYVTSATVNSGKSVAPGAQGAYSMSFIAPEAAGSVTDTFQLNSASSVFFGPTVSVQVVVAQAGSTNQYDRAKAVSYANNYAGYVASDGYFWTNGSYYGYYGTGVMTPVPTADGIGDDCAHFVSCCIGSEPHQKGGGLAIATRDVTYGEPGAARLVQTNLLAVGLAVEVSSLSQLSPGDIIAWNWESETNLADIDHDTLYLGNGLLAAHSASCLDVSATTWYQGSESEWVWHLIHIYDAPTITVSKVKTNLVVSWAVGWTNYVLYSATSPSAGATWTKVSKSPVVKGALNMVTNAMSSGAVYYRLVHP